MGLQQFEQRLERLVEGAFARAFRGELQPIELGRRLTREMDLHRAVSVRGLVAPNSFSLVLSRSDFDRFGGFTEVLQKELVDAAKEHARSEGYSFLGPVVVKMSSDDRIAKSTYTITANMVESAAPFAGEIVLPDGKRIIIDQDVLKFGRLPDCAIFINDPNVSRHHAEIRRNEDRAWLVDLGSTNGTRVNGIRVGEHLLHHGDVITVGRTSFRYEND